MAGMISSKRNRGMRSVDDPWDSDGFYAHRKFKGNRKAGAPTGKRAWRRTLRAKEQAEARRIIKSELN